MPIRPGAWVGALTTILLLSGSLPGQPRAPREVNDLPVPSESGFTAITGGTLIDGRGGPPVSDAVVLIRQAHIVAAGPRHSVPIPAGAAVIDGTGATVLPGLLDAHFHLDGDLPLPNLFLRHCVTSRSAA